MNQIRIGNYAKLLLVSKFKKNNFLVLQDPIFQFGLTVNLDKI